MKGYSNRLVMVNWNDLRKKMLVAEVREAHAAAEVMKQKARNLLAKPSGMWSKIEDDTSISTAD